MSEEETTTEGQHHVTTQEQQPVTTAGQQETKTGDIPAGGFPCPYPGCDKVCRTQMGLEMHHRRVHRTSLSKPSRGRETMEGETGEPLPDALTQLDTILREHGFKRRDVVLRAMKLRDPTDLRELAWVLDDLGINRSRIRRVLRDYAKWLGVSIPEDVIARLSPPERRVKDDYGYVDRWGRPVQRRRGEVSETAELIEALAQYQRASQSHNPRQGGELAALRQEVTALRQVNDSLIQKLEEEKDRRWEDRFKSLENLVKEKGDFVTTSVRELFDFLKIAARASSGMLDEPPEREKMPRKEGEKTFTEKLIEAGGEEYVEIED